MAHKERNPMRAMQWVILAVVVLGVAATIYFNRDKFGNNDSDNTTDSKTIAPAETL